MAQIDDALTLPSPAALQPVEAPASATVAPRAAPDAHREAAQRDTRRATVRLEAIWARDADDVRAAQALRHRVFAGEMGARLTPPPGTPAGLDVDLFDAHCEHLLVRTAATDHEPAQVVGTYRVLTPEAARRVGGFYSDTEFDLVRLAPLRERMVELGRSCTDPQWRTGGVILMLWTSLAQFMQANGLRRMIGCASVPMTDGGRQAAALWRQLALTHLAPIEHRVTPRLPLPVDSLLADGSAPEGRGEVWVPPLIKGYLGCGARILGAPAWDPDFGCADLPMMLDLADIPAGHRRRFLGG